MRMISTMLTFKVVTAVAIAAIVPSSTSACGTFELFFARYAGDSIQLEQLLQNLECVAFTAYQPEKHADPLFTALLKSVRAKSGLRSAGNLFAKYECLPSMRQHSEYVELVDAFGEERCTPEGFFNASSNQLLIVSVSTARIRKDASLEAGIIDGAPRGNIVKRLAQEGDWYRIKTRWGNLGYVHASCLRKREVGERSKSD